MRIYVYAGTLTGRGGVETVFKLFAREVKRQGHELTFLFMTPSTKDTGWEAELGQVIHLSRGLHDVGDRHVGENQVVSSILDLQAVLSKLPRPDVIIGIAPWMVAIASCCVKIYEKPPLLISWMHASLHAFQERHLLSYADAHLAISSGIREQFAELGARKPVSVVFNPVDTVGTRRVSPSHENIFVYMGRIDNRQKRLDVLFRALGNQGSTWKLKLFGDAGVGDNTDKNKLQSLAKELSIEEQIEWLGWKSDPWSELEEATALILPSDWEGFGMVLVEALARGLPVIASNCFTGPADIVQHGVNGWLFQPGNVEELSSILRSVINKTIKIPNGDVCVESVQKFSSQHVVGNILNSLQHYIYHLS